jgi:twitching motility protein PilU
MVFRAETAKSPILDLLSAMSAAKASDLYLTFGAPPMARGDTGLVPLAPTALDDAGLNLILADLAAPEALADFARTKELNLALDLGPTGRFRVNAFRQRQHPGLVVRHIPAAIPTLEELRLPVSLGGLCLEKRGLVIVVGGTGSGKSTSLAAMLDYRNRTQSGHIVTIEDPIEFIHEHRQCLVTQREVGIDTISFEAALKNALRQKPDIILIGEIRDAATMEHAINIAETGHLCLATLHANNANQAIERVINFFPHEAHAQLLLNLSLNLKAVVSQRLVPTLSGKRTVALEIMLNLGLIKDLIAKGEIRDIKPAIAAANEQGMRTFDQSLMQLVRDGAIAEDVAFAEADSPTDLQLLFRRMKTGAGAGLAGVDTSKLSL